MKFNLNDRVLIKSLGKEGIVTKWFVEWNADDCIREEYTVCYQDNRLVDYGSYGDLHVAEYLGQKNCYMTVTPDAIELLKQFDELVKAYQLSTATKEQLDRLADIHSSSRGEEEMDSIKPKCEHSWAEYDSGWSKYEYCKHCDVKKDE